jgi:hypothetical protein
MATTAAKPAPKKRGNPGSFHGQRAIFLESWIEKYTECSRKKTTAALWHRMFPQYWANFNWRSPLTEDFVGPIAVDTSDDWVAPELEKEVLTPEEETQKSTTVAHIQQVSNVVF